MAHATRQRCTKNGRETVVASCVVLALLMAAVMHWAMQEPWRVSRGLWDEQGGSSGHGTGHGMSGDGSGAGLKGDGPGADPRSYSNEPQGMPSGVMAQTAKPPSGTDTPQLTRRAAPEFGFTSPDEVHVQQPRAEPRPVDPIGSGGGAAREGATGAARQGRPEFMGVKGDGMNVVYILDFSGSMADEKISHLKIELKKSIFSLSSKNKFQVILFNTFAIENPNRGMLPATKQNTQACANWVDEEQVTGSTNPVRALEIALSQLKPDTIYLLTDGAFDSDADVFAVISRLNPEGKVQINTIGFGIGANVHVLERIAQENRGKYRYVDVPAPVPP